MNPVHDDHLTHDELITAAVDMQDLVGMRKAHLKACPACCREVDRLVGRCEGIGRMAARLAPRPDGPFRLPAGRTAIGRRFRTPVWVVGLAATMLLTAVFVRPMWHKGVNLPTSAELASDRQLMASIDTLVQDALPAPYRQLVLMDEPAAPPAAPIDTDDDDDFMDWIVPPSEDHTTDETLL